MNHKSKNTYNDLIIKLGDSLPNLPPQPKFDDYKKMTHDEYVDKILNPWLELKNQYDASVNKYLVRMDRVSDRGCFWLIGVFKYKGKYYYGF